jgi:hypothetical protein
MSRRWEPWTGHMSNLGDPAAHYLIIYMPAHAILMITSRQMRVKLKDHGRSGLIA